MTMSCVVAKRYTAEKLLRRHISGFTDSLLLLSENAAARTRSVTAEVCNPQHDDTNDLHGIRPRIAEKMSKRQSI